MGDDPAMDKGNHDSRRCGCRFERTAPAHHHRLISLETAPMSSLVELIEIAATWGEIEYGETDPVIPPSEWIAFAETHAWDDSSRVLDAFIALASLVPRFPSRLATVTPLFAVVPDTEPVHASV